MAAPMPVLPVSPDDVIEAADAEKIAEVIQLGAFKSLPPVVDQPEVGLPLILGIGVETALLKNQAWDNFWIGVGGRLNNVWHNLTGSLFGHGGISADQLHLAINLSQHITARMIRQLSANWMGRLGGLSNLTVKGLQSLAQGIRNLQGQVNQLRKDAQGWANKAQANAEAAALKGLKSLRDQFLQDQRQQDKDLERWAVTYIQHPLQKDIQDLRGGLQDLRKWVTGTIVPEVEHYTDSRLAKEAALLGAVAAAVARLTQEAEDCTEPMCETQGPKTDWGKLFKKFSPTILLALLALWEREDPEQVEAAAEKLADVLGPVLEMWTEAWLGVAPGDTAPAESAVAKEAGHGPLP